MTDSLPPLRDIIARDGLVSKKSLGQNFLLDLNLTAQIVRLAGPVEDATIVEVGPGPGGLTRSLLLQGARKVLAIEHDKRCMPALQEISAKYPGRLQIFNEDALRFSCEAFLPREKNSRVMIVANLPYNIATKLLIGWLRSPRWPPFYQSMTLMFQKEVAQRICAKPGSKSYGRLAIISRWRTNPRIVMKLPARVFTPPPKIDSAVVHLVPIEPAGEPCGLDYLEKVTAAAFGQRRKMLRSSLRQISKNPEQLLKMAEIDPKKRAEQLSVEDFTRLARQYEISQV